MHTQQNTLTVAGTIGSAFATIALSLFPAGLAAQTVAGQSVEGNWMRYTSNYDPNDKMRIAAGGGEAVVTFIRNSGGETFREGQVLWKQIQADGSFLVMGSDGGYYPATMKFEGSDLIHVDVHHNGAGNDQTWSRAGPTIDGDWVRVGRAGDPEDGMKIRVEADEAAIAYLPATASHRLRIGIRLWQGIGADGGLQVMGSDGRFGPARLTLENEDRLRVDLTRYGTSQVWVRPGTETLAQRPGAGPPEAGSGGAPGAPGTPEAEPLACASSSLLDDDMGGTWGWGLTSERNEEQQHGQKGLTDFVLGRFEGSSKRYSVATDIEPYEIPGLTPGFAFAWQPRNGRMWEEHRDLTSAEYHEWWEQYDAMGYRPTDFEAYMTPDGLRYAGIWVLNTEGVDWWSRRDMTSEEYGSTFGNQAGAGFQLVDMEAYQAPSGLRYASIWVRSCDPDSWKHGRDMSRENYLARTTEMTDLGFKVVDFESYQVGDEQKYAVIWEKVSPARAWAVRTDRTLKGFLNNHREYMDLGFRLVDFESYETADGRRFAGVWAENDPRYRFALRPMLDDTLEAYRTQHGIPGISAAIIQNGDVIYQAGFGWADSAAAKTANASTVYFLASASKAIGATLAKRLEQRGLIDLSKPTSDYVDDMPDQHVNSHTLEQLLSKTGCMFHYDEGPEPSEQYYKYRTEALKQIWDTPLLQLYVDGNNWLRCVPGSNWHYSTHGFTFVGAALEAVMGEPIADILRNELTRPLALESMRPASPEVPSPEYELAQGYQGNPVATVGYDDSSWKFLGGGIKSNALDLARFGWIVLSGTYVTDPDTAMWASKTASATLWLNATGTFAQTGLAWEVRQLADGTNVAEHGGSWNGARSNLGIYQEDNLVIALLTNTRTSALGGGHLIFRAGGLGDRIRQIVVNNPPPP